MSLRTRSLSHIGFSRALLACIVVVAVSGLLLHGPIAQDPTYHHFADTRALLGIDNALNVLTNLPFLVVGLYGLWRVPRLAKPATHAAYVTLCIGALGVGLGSAWYHWAPSTPALLWDRLPMTVAFMALFSMLLDERHVLQVRTASLWPLVAFGIASVLYWYWTETRGVGDLRAYVLVQFLPLVMIPLVLALFPARYIATRWLLAALGLYVLAKLGEHFDARIFEMLQAASGHSIKHLLAAAALGCIVQAVPVRMR